jgi:hypothetical protein
MKYILDITLDLIKVYLFLEMFLKIANILEMLYLLV